MVLCPIVIRSPPVVPSRRIVDNNGKVMSWPKSLSVHRMPHDGFGCKSLLLLSHHAAEAGELPAHLPSQSAKPARRLRRGRNGLRVVYSLSEGITSTSGDGRSDGIG